MEYLNTAMPLIILLLTGLGGYLGKQLGISRANERQLYEKNTDLKVEIAELKGENKAAIDRLDERSKFAVYKD